MVKRKEAVTLSTQAGDGIPQDILSNVRETICKKSPVSAQTRSGQKRPSAQSKPGPSNPASASAPQAAERKQASKPNPKEKTVSKQSVPEVVSMSSSPDPVKKVQGARPQTSPQQEKESGSVLTAPRLTIKESSSEKKGAEKYAVPQRARRGRGGGSSGSQSPHPPPPHNRPKKAEQNSVSSYNIFSSLSEDQVSEDEMEYHSS